MIHNLQQILFFWCSTIPWQPWQPSTTKRAGPTSRHLNSTLVALGSICSRILSSFGIQEANKWQFWSNTWARAARAWWLTMGTLGETPLGGNSGEKPWKRVGNFNKTNWYDDLHKIIRLGVKNTNIAGIYIWMFISHKYRNIGLDPSKKMVWEQFNYQYIWYLQDPA